MNLLCKLHLHKYKIVKRLSGGDYPKYQERCERCNKTVIATYNALGNPFVINRSDLDESENVRGEGKFNITIDVKPTIWFRICIFKLEVMEKFNPIGAFVFSEQLVQDIQKHSGRYIKIINLRRKD